MNAKIGHLLGPRVTVALVFLAAGFYLSLTFANESAWGAMVGLLTYSPALKAMAWVLVLQVFLSGTIRLVRGRLRALPAGMILVSLALLLAGALLSLQERESSRVRVNASEMVGEGLTVLEVHVKLPPRVLSIGESLEFEQGRASAVLDDRGRRVEVRPFPPAVTSRGLAYVDDAGASPRFRFARGSEVIETDKLALLPPGRRVHVSLGDQYAAEIALAPAREFAKGRLTAREYSLVAPSYRVSLKRGTEVLGDVELKDSEQARLAGVTVGAGDAEGWVELVFVRDSYAALAWAGVIGMLAGIVLLPLWAGVRAAVKGRTECSARW